MATTVLVRGQKREFRDVKGGYKPPSEDKWIPVHPSSSPESLTPFPEGKNVAKEKGDPKELLLGFIHPSPGFAGLASR